MELDKDSQNTDEYANRLMIRKIRGVFTSHQLILNIMTKINLVRNDLRKIRKDNFIYDSADKLVHKIPLKHTIDSEQAIPIILGHTKTPGTISTESE